MIASPHHGRSSYLRGANSRMRHRRDRGNQMPGFPAIRMRPGQGVGIKHPPLSTKGYTDCEYPFDLRHRTASYAPQARAKGMLKTEHTPPSRYHDALDCRITPERYGHDDHTPP